MISDLTIISQIQLPGKDLDSPPPQEALDQTWYHVRISEEGVFSILEDGGEDLLYVDIDEIEPLEGILNQMLSSDDLATQVNLIVEPSPRVPMQKLVDLLDLCERLNLPPPD